MKSVVSVLDSILLFVIILICLNPFFNSPLFFESLVIPKYYSLLLFSSSFTLLAVVRFLLRKGNIYFNKTDVLLVVFFLYVITLQLLNRNESLTDYSFLLFLSLIPFIFSLKYYVSIKEGPCIKQVIFVVLIIISILECTIGICQFFSSYVHSIKNPLQVTGTFDNSGSFSIYLASIFPVSLFMVIRSKRNILRVLSLVNIFLCISVIIITKSRTSWVAVGAITFIVTLIETQIFNKLVYSLRNGKIWKFIIPLMAIVTLVSVSVLIYKVKPDSANGRFLTWKISSDIVLNKTTGFLFGHGFNEFPVAYNNFKSAYFSSHPLNSYDGFIASDIVHAFNDYLEIAVNIGIVGLFLIVFIILSAIRTKQQDNFIKYILISAAICAFFSYVVINYSITAIVCIAIAMISGEAKDKAESRTAVSYISIIIFTGIALFSIIVTIPRIKSEIIWKASIDEFDKTGNPGMVSRYENVYQDLKRNPYYLFNYAQVLAHTGRYNRSNQIIAETLHYLNDSEVYILQGENFYKQADLLNAYSSFDKASKIVPHKFHPRYMKVIIDTKIGRMDNAIKEAEIISQMKVKVPSKLVKNIKEDIAVFLVQYGRVDSEKLYQADSLVNKN